MATKVIVKKTKNLTAFLRSMKLGETVEIGEKEYRTANVRSAVCRLRKRYSNLDFICTQAGMPDGCKVTRIK